jgi:hypothetical protein
MNEQHSLKIRAIRRLVITLLALAAMLFGTTGSFRFWQGWIFLLVMAGSWSYFLVVLLRRDPELIER